MYVCMYVLDTTHISPFMIYVICHSIFLAYVMYCKFCSNLMRWCKKKKRFNNLLVDSCFTKNRVTEEKHLVSSYTTCSKAV